MKSAPLTIALAIGLSVAGCATIISGTAQLMTVNANVDGAEVHLVTEAGETLLGATPLSTRVQRGQEGTLRVSAPGYRPYQAALNRKINNVFWVNIFIGGLFGSTTDYTTGAMYEYEPSTFMVSLQPAQQSPEEAMRWQRTESLRGFLLLNGEALSYQLAEGEGEHIDVLLQAYAVEPDGRADAIERWRTVYSTSRTAAHFAQTMVDDFTP